MELTQEQKAISDAVLDWHKSSRRAPYLAVSGYAGTGKTTLMGMTANRLIEQKSNMAIAYCAPTGKAVSVLHSKLASFGALNKESGAFTVHSLLYNCRGKNKKNELIFTRKSKEEMYPWDLIVVDEASMVTDIMFHDLLNLHIPLLFIGDSGQLPPVNAPLFKPIIETDLVLKTIQRQALDNPIIKYAHEVRQGGKVPFGSFKGKLLHLKKHERYKFLTQHVYPRMLDLDMVILTYMNSTRVLQNKNVRRVNNLFSDLPMPGEKLVALKNSRDYDLRNGEQVVLKSIAPAKNSSCYFARLHGNPYDICAFSGALNAVQGDDIGELLHKHGADVHACMQDVFLSDEPYLFDYGYAMSVHKAQGSEWKTVVLMEERPGRVSNEDFARWMYTGMTRAKNQLIIC